MSRESWLNGWPRMGVQVIIGNATHCAGCGKFNGVTCVVIADDWESPEKMPDWPFDEENCPVCWLMHMRPEEPQFDMRAGPKGKLP